MMSLGPKNVLTSVQDQYYSTLLPFNPHPINVFNIQRKRNYCKTLKVSTYFFPKHYY